MELDWLVRTESSTTVVTLRSVLVSYKIHYAFLHLHKWGRSAYPIWPAAPVMQTVIGDFDICTTIPNHLDAQNARLDQRRCGMEAEVAAPYLVRACVPMTSHFLSVGSPFLRIRLKTFKNALARKEGVGPPRLTPPLCPRS